MHHWFKDHSIGSQSVQALVISVCVSTFQHKNVFTESAKVNNYSSPCEKKFVSKLQWCPWCDGTMQRILQALDISGYLYCLVYNPRIKFYILYSSYDAYMRKAFNTDNLELQLNNNSIWVKILLSYTFLWMDSAENEKKCLQTEGIYP